MFKRCSIITDNKGSKVCQKNTTHTSTPPTAAWITDTKQIESTYSSCLSQTSMLPSKMAEVVMQSTSMCLEVQCLVDLEKLFCIPRWKVECFALNKVSVHGLWEETIKIELLKQTKNFRRETFWIWVRRVSEIEKLVSFPTMAWILGWQKEGLSHRVAVCFAWHTNRPWLEHTPWPTCC